MRRNKISSLDLFAQLANKHFQKHIKTKGLILGKGTIVDATLQVAQATSRSGR